MRVPTRPELVSSDFLALPEPSRPALTPNEPHPARLPRRFPNRTFAILAGAVALILSLAFWLHH